MAAAPELHLAETRRAPTLLVVDEVHHLPLPAGAPGEAPDEDEAGAWSRAMRPLLAAAAFRLLLSGTLERADGRRILGLPYHPAPAGAPPEIDLDAPGLAVIGYSRAQALAERAVLPVNFGALDGEASWLQGGRAAGQSRVGPHRLSARGVRVTTRPALFTALRTGFASELLARRSTRRAPARPAPAGARPRRRARRRRASASSSWSRPTRRAPGAISASLRAWMPRRQGERDVRLATSSARRAGALAAFRLRPTRRSSSPWRWPTRGSTRPRSPWWRR